MTGALLDWAREACAGDVAADALSEGPSCGRSAVDNRQEKRMLSAVLDPDPCPQDSEAVFRRVPQAVAERHVVLKGITTEGSALAPAPIRTVGGAVPHQLCPLHGIKERTQGVLQAVAKERARWATATPTVQRGRPSSTDQDARRRARQSQARQQQLSAVVQDRFVCVTRRLTPSARQRLLSITRGLPHRRKLREIMEHLDALCDRRCRTQTAQGKLKQWRHWVQRFTWLGAT